MSNLAAIAAVLIVVVSHGFAQVDSLPPEVRKQISTYFEREGPKLGQDSPDFTLDDTVEGKIHASERWAKKPLLLVTGSYSCPFFRHSAQPLKELIGEFGDRVNIVFLYTLEVHPSDAPSPYSEIPITPVDNQTEGISVPKAKSLSDRMRAARLCGKSLGISVPIAVDTMDNATWKAFGKSMNAAYLIGTDGKIILQQGLCEPKGIREALKKVTGR